MAFVNVHYLFSLIFLFGTVPLLLSHCTPPLSGPPNCFTNQCRCSTSKTTTIFCNDIVFPEFTFYTTYPVSEVVVVGSFTAVYDNAFYLLMDMANANICLEWSGASYQHSLTTYENTFLTKSTNGIGNLTFYYFTDLNISIWSNTKYIPELNIYYGQLSAVPDLKRFTSLQTVSFYSSDITSLQPTDFDLASLVTIDVRYNALTALNANAFNFKSLKIIYAENNKIATVDPRFSEWLASSVHNQIRLNENGPFQCDSDLQWMGTYIICPPQTQILVTVTASCLTGETLINYLIPYAACT